MLTVFPGTGLPFTSFNVTVTMIADVPSAAAVLGVAMMEERVALTGDDGCVEV